MTTYFSIIIFYLSQNLKQLENNKFNHSISILFKRSRCGYFQLQNYLQLQVYLMIWFLNCLLSIIIFSHLFMYTLYIQHS